MSGQQVTIAGVLVTDADGKQTTGSISATDSNGNLAANTVISDLWMVAPSNYGEGATFTATTGAEGNSGAIVSSAKYVDIVAFIVDGSPGVVNINIGPGVTADANDYPVAMNQTYRIPFTSGDTISAWNPVASGQSVLVYFHPVG